MIRRVIEGSGMVPDDELTHYEFKYKALPDKAAKLHTLMLGDVAAITTENR